MAEFPDLLTNPNPNAPSLDLSANQVRGLGFFNTTGERDSLSANVRVLGHLAVIKSSDEVYQYTGADTGNAAWTDTANWLAIGSGGGGANSFRAEIQGAGVTSGLSRVALKTSILNSEGLPLVSSTNGNLGEYDYRRSVIGIYKEGLPGETTDVFTYGKVEEVGIVVLEGETPIPGGRLYSGAASAIYAQSSSGYYSDSSSNTVVGILIGEATYVSSFPNYFDVYSATVFVNIPWSGEFYSDGVGYSESHRIKSRNVGTVNKGEIVKYDTLVAPGSYTYASRWDSSTDTQDQIAGVAMTDEDAEVACSGDIVLDITLIAGTAPVAGDVIYSDSTNSYQLTTASTSGVKIGLVQRVNGDDVHINLKFI